MATMTDTATITLNTNGNPSVSHKNSAIPPHMNMMVAMVNNNPYSIFFMSISDWVSSFLRYNPFRCIPPPPLRYVQGSSARTLGSACVLVLQIAYRSNRLSRVYILLLSYFHFSIPVPSKDSFFVCFIIFTLLLQPFLTVWHVTSMV